MVKLSQADKKMLDNQYDLLIGNLNRMCVTDSLGELKGMYDYARERVDRIYVLNKKRFEKKNED